MSSFKNYITPNGLRSLQEEFNQLSKVERPQVTETVAWAAGNGDRSENGDYLYGKKRLREIDRRLHYLSKRIQSAELIDPETVRADEVRFGATVKLLTEDGEEKTYTIVGEDEANASQGKISWRAPLASALMRKRAGDFFTFRAPQGEQELEVLDVQYLPVR